MAIEGLRWIASPKNELEDLLLECIVLLAHELTSLPYGLLQGNLCLWNEGELEESTFEIFNKFLCQVSPRLIPNKVYYVLDVRRNSLISVNFTDHGWPPCMTPHFRPNNFLSLKFRHGVAFILNGGNIYARIDLLMGLNISRYHFDAHLIFLFLHL